MALTNLSASALILLSACVFPLGKAPTVRGSTPPRSELCDSIARERDAWTLATAITGTLGGGAGISSLPIESARAELVGTGAALGLTSVITGLIAAERSQRYTRVCD
jgi:hypothetical protein